MNTYPQQEPTPAVHVSYLARSSNGQAVAGMVLGILAVIIEWGGLLTLALAVTAIIFGAVGLNQSRETGSGHGQAVAGVTLAGSSGACCISSGGSSLSDCSS